jgi:protein-disulfide isomerase
MNRRGITWSTMALGVALTMGAAWGQTTAVERCKPAPDAVRNPADDVVALVADQPVLERDLDNAVKSQLMALRNQEYQIRSKTLEELIKQRVVEAEAKKQGLTVEQLFAKNVDAYLNPPSNAEVYAYYLGVRPQMNKPFEEVKAQLQTTLRGLEIKAGRDMYVDYLRGKASVSEMLDAPRAKVGTDSGRVRGDANAPVTIVEFADYQCPYCEKVEATIQELMKKYPGKVKVAFRDFPLSSIHPNAQQAAEASRCAAKQGKFWEYHDALFGAQAKLDEPGLKSVAHDLKLDEKAFSACLASGEFTQPVAQDQQDGAAVGIASTPGFFINGIFLSGAQPIAEFEKLIDGELKSSANQKASTSPR